MVKVKKSQKCRAWPDWAYECPERTGPDTEICWTSWKIKVSSLLLYSQVNYHASWQSWQGRGPAHARIRWCGRGWRTSWDANNQETSPASRRLSIPKERLWRGSLGPDPVAKPESEKRLYLVINIFISLEISLVMKFGSTFLDGLSIPKDRLWRGSLGPYPVAKSRVRNVFHRL